MQHPGACVDCSREEVAAVYNTPLLDLVYRAASVHRMYNDPQMVSCHVWQLCLFTVLCVML